MGDRADRCFGGRDCRGVSGRSGLLDFLPVWQPFDATHKAETGHQRPHGNPFRGDKAVIELLCSTDAAKTRKQLQRARLPSLLSFELSLANCLVFLFFALFPFEDIQKSRRDDAKGF